MATDFVAACLDCGHTSPFDPMQAECPTCGSEWREARYDLEALAPVFLERLHGRPFDLWRYLELLPVRQPSPNLSLGEGGTPLYRAENLAMMLGLPNLFIKDERQGPTASFKDRQAAVTVAALKEAGITEAVVASTGNVAIAFSAYCARAGIQLWAFLTSLVPGAKMHEVALYGTKVVKLTATYDQAKQLAGEFARQRGLYFDRGARSIPAVESMKTIAFEIAEQLSQIVGLPGGRGKGSPPWRAPDWYVQAVSGGIGPLGVLKGFQELHSLGLIDRIPAIACVQAEGCAPMAAAWARQADTVEPVLTPETYISTLSTGDPGRVYSLLRPHLLATGGAMTSVSDEEAIRAMHMLAKMEGLSVEPAAAVAFAGLLRLVQEGHIEPDQVVVVNCSGHTMPVEEELLGEDWVHELATSEAVAVPEGPQEGLLGALARLDQRRVREVLVVDDHEEARRLIRRILQAQGDFHVLEAASGPEALEKVAQHRPDLVILDLMMPEMDGFEVLERMKHLPATSRIPVIVVTAKELTAHEKRRLEGQIARLMTKGDFLSEDLLEEIARALE